MPWTVEVAPRAARTLASLDRPTQVRIQRYTAEWLAAEADPRRYRVGEYRLFCRIEEGLCLVMILAVGHRREVYK